MRTKLTTQEMEEAIQVYFELTGKRITKEANPMDLMMMVHNTFRSTWRRSNHK